MRKVRISVLRSERLISVLILLLIYTECKEYQDYLRIPLSLSLAPSKADDPITCLLPPGQFIAGGRDAQLYEYPHVVSVL